MTNEEAINALKMMNLRGAHPFLHWEEMMEVRDMAISALRQQEHFREVTKKVEPLTNAQKIRAMTDEELAKAIFNWFYVKEHCDMCVPEMRTPKKCNGRCTSGILRWLQQPAEEDEAK